MKQTVTLHPAITHRHFAVIDSTNAYLMKNELPCPYLVSADTQTAGHGRRQQAWIDEGKSLLFSLATAFDAHINVGAWSVQVALTLAKILENVTEQALLIKWPNDLYVKNDSGEYGKCAGILTESSIGKQGKMVTGAGINLAPIKGVIDSDYAIASVDICVDDSVLLIQIANELYWQWQDFIQSPAVSPEHYARYDMLSGEMLLATNLHNHRESVGQACGINAQGQLLLQQHGGLLALTTQHHIRLL
ncbi:MAG: biotin--[acetyl-CoA-carboxylase] ligase [Gammaproteobacteria bacterium]|nr:MAG: biotin--[acetyl-CoA-carboxylase] ligase [Gammaproteobacteria bacterium]